MKRKMVISGIDEAGRGALAGPLVASAVILPADFSLSILSKRLNFQVRGGKSLTSLQRNAVYNTIKELAFPIEIEIISTLRINNNGIQKMNKEILRSLIKRTNSDLYICDGNIPIGRVRQKTHKIQSLIRADDTEPAVILAGLVAKVARDNVMIHLHKKFPVYGWSQNKGYGTKKHVQAIRKYGSTRYHRGIFITTALMKQNNRNNLLKRS